MKNTDLKVTHNSLDELINKEMEKVLKKEEEKLTS